MGAMPYPAVFADADSQRAITAAAEAFRSSPAPKHQCEQAMTGSNEGSHTRFFQYIA